MSFLYCCAPKLRPAPAPPPRPRPLPCPAVPAGAARRRQSAQDSAARGRPERQRARARASAARAKMSSRCSSVTKSGNGKLCGTDSRCHRRRPPAAAAPHRPATPHLHKPLVVEGDADGEAVVEQHQRRRQRRPPQGRAGRPRRHAPGTAPAERGAPGTGDGGQGDAGDGAAAGRGRGRAGQGGTGTPRC